MKVIAVLLLAICAVECRKIVQINKNANIDFINMESGGGPQRPTSTVRTLVSVPAPAKPQSPEPSKTPVVQPKPPVQVVTTVKPVTVPVPTVPPTQIKPLMPNPGKPLPNQMDLKPVPAKPAAAGGSTPGYSNVKQLVTFYDSKGQASVIRPYSYADAVKKQG